MAKRWETFFKGALGSIMPTGSRTIELAAKHGVPITNSKFYVGAPGVRRLEQLKHIAIMLRMKLINIYIQS